MLLVEQTMKLEAALKQEREESSKSFMNKFTEVEAQLNELLTSNQGPAAIREEFLLSIIEEQIKKLLPKGAVPS